MPKIVLKAPLYDDSGYAVWARGLLNALTKVVSGTDTTVHVIPLLWAGNSFVAGLDPSKVHELAPVLAEELRQGDTLIQLTLPQEFRPVRGVRNIGIFTFEASRISGAWAAACNKMDEIWVPTHSVQTSILLSEVEVPVYVVPIGCDSQEPVEAEKTIDLSAVETPFNFLCCGQWLPGAYGVDRKNIAATVGAFCEAFRGNERVGLILKTFESSQSSMDRARIVDKVAAIRRQVGVAGAPNVYVVHGRLTATEMLSMYIHPKVRALVSLSHGEGWWHEGAEAAYAGLPIIAPGYGAHTAFLQTGLYAEIPYQIAPVGTNWKDVYEPEHMFWANPSVPDAKRMMLRCYDKYEQANERALKQQSGMSSFTWKAITETVRQRLGVK